MPASLFDNPLFPLFHDPALAQVFCANHAVSLYGRVEAALTAALAAEGIVSPQAETAILCALETFDISATNLGAASFADGIPLPAYVRALKDAVGAPHGAVVHAGSTSQDIMDTASAMALREANAILANRLDALIAALDDLSTRFGEKPLMGRTRMQAALPVGAAHRIAGWRAPLARQRIRFVMAAADVEVLQFGGPVGTREGFDGRGQAVAARMAEALSLSEPGAAWHTGRDGLASYGAWLSATSAALGKLGQDVALMAQQGLSEVGLAAGGGSSAMAHKRNPVAAEALVTLAHYSAAQLAALHTAAVAEQERSGIAWMLETMVLPSLVLSTGVGLLRAHELVGAITRIGDP